ncbi:ABC transporter permease [Ferrovibrio sp.]|uniref:ABC transporter permease n=1 Tax=Ferrovibrio sp. TaxID=1917215 RepID=UPI001B4F00B9|nr:ABC transporter permease [Ferrovibrio sp.]MBP7064559.1 ABC transporter permease [Ferrovibrio sp.]
MLRALGNIWHLGVKELRSLRTDPILIGLILYTFTVAVYSVSTGVRFEVERAAVAIVDEDRSGLSRRIAEAVQEPYFRPPQLIAADAIDRVMDDGAYVFVLEIPPRFEADLLAGRRPALQINIDATAMATAGNGATYLTSIIGTEILTWLGRSDAAKTLPANVVVRARFNPNGQSAWFMAVMQVINNITILAVILTGAALIREREHGTVEHLLVMPVAPLEIMLAKIWANGLVILVAASLSLSLVVQWLLGIPIAGSISLFILGATIYMFSVAALGILIATFSGSMPQFGLLSMPILIVLNLLSGSTTPLESMPGWLQIAVQLSPATQFVAFSQGVLYRGAGLEIAWPYLLSLAGIGVGYFLIALLRFKRMLAQIN